MIFLNHGNLEDQKTNFEIAENFYNIIQPENFEIF